ncbi:MAG TPA: pyridoxal-phosphate dependent enzyme, partial [Nocardioidaceae bacterium]|nr:pyridoxal-phosphate dependent enzyme [Nocardioidaceae bacterium]
MVVQDELTLPHRSDVESAAARLGEKVRHTPTLVLHGDELGVPFRVVLKLELFQHTGSFKARGALNSVMSLDPSVRAVAAASGGNHGAAVAWAAGRAGLTADIFVPSTSTPAKLQRIEEYGGHLHAVDGDVGDALEVCHEFSRRQGIPVVHPYDTFETVSGAGTLGLEVGGAVPDASLVLLGCGGGGLYAGVVAALGHDIPVIPVETELCPHMHVAREAGRPVRHASAGLAADSLGPPQVGRFGYETAVAHGSTSMLVTEDELVAARTFLWDRVRVLAEPGASVALAAVMSGRVDVEPGSTVVVVVSGGNNPAIP